MGNIKRYSLTFDEMGESEYGVKEDPNGKYIIVKSYKNSLPIIKEVK